jgi:uncharacterized protein YjdB
MSYTPSIVTMGMAALLAACNAGIDGSPTETTPKAVLTSVTIGPPISAAATGRFVAVGSTAQLTASPKDQNGSAIAAAVTWTSSAPGFATVNRNTGLVSGIAMGAATITVSAVVAGDSVTANTVFLVLAVPIASARLLP